MKPEQISTSSNEDLVRFYEHLLAVQEDAENGISVVKDELFDRLKKDKVDAKIINDYVVSAETRISFKPPLELAKERCAVKTALDNTALKELYNKEIEVPNTVVTHYIIIRHREDKNDNT